MGREREVWPDGGRELFRRQLGVVRREQLRLLGVGPAGVDANVEARRWTTAGPCVVVLDNGRLDVEQLRWVAVLHHGADAALCAWTALQAWGLRGFERPDIHVVLARGSAVVRPPRLPATRVDGLRSGPTGRPVAGIAVPRIVLHESRRHLPEDVVAAPSGQPSHGPARAVVDAGAWGPTDRAAAALLLAAVQQRLVTPAGVLDALESAGQVRRRRLMRAVAADAAGGVDALSELDFARMCRSAGIAEPVRQTRRRDSDGRWRYLDVLWRRPDGRWLLVEVDGRGHLDVETWEDDLLRANDVVIRDDAIVLRVPATVVRAEPARVLAQLRRALAGELSPPPPP